MYKIAVIGDKTSALGFKALGTDVYTIEKEEPIQIWERIPFNEYGIIILTEQVYLQLKDLVEEKSKDFLPVFLIIPSSLARLGLGKLRLKKFIEKAVGADLLSKGGKV